tara:strand:- start:713 stop:898 length:186 start_codon:yes stop_codon:yes gene_type:complete
MLLKTPINTTKFAKIKLNSNLKINATELIVANCPIIPIHLKLTYVVLFKCDDLELVLNSIN